MGSLLLLSPLGDWPSAVPGNPSSSVEGGASAVPACPGNRLPSLELRLWATRHGPPDSPGGRNSLPGLMEGRPLLATPEGGAPLSGLMDSRSSLFSGWTKTLSSWGNLGSRRSDSSSELPVLGQGGPGLREGELGGSEGGHVE